MFSMFKRNNAGEVPEWAAFFDKQEYTAFFQAIDAYFTKKNLHYVFGDGLLTVDENAFGFSTAGLTNLSQSCKLSGKTSSYAQIVTDHFEAMRNSHVFDKEMEEIIGDYEQVKQYIGVRLYPVDYLAQVKRENTLGKDFAGDIYAMLIFDMPYSIKNIQPSEAEPWGKSLDELFEIGISNMRKAYPINLTTHDTGDFEVFFANADHFFTPNIVFDLPAYPQLIGEQGCLIGIPHRHSVLIFPISDLKVINAINMLIPAVFGMNQEGPGSISNQLFWYKDGEFTSITYEIGEDNLQITPPAAFVEMLNSLDELPE